MIHPSVVQEFVMPTLASPQGPMVFAPRPRGSLRVLPGLLLGLAAMAAAAGAQAHGGVQWSIGIQLPPVGTVITSGPPVPVHPVYGPPPVVYVPPPRVVHVPPPVIYAPPPVVYAPPPGWGWGARPHHRPGWKDHGWRDRDRDGVPDHRDPWDDRRRPGW